MPPRKRESRAKQQCKLICCTTPPEALERIRADLKVWVAGKWAEELNVGPACHCGLRAAKEPCPRHGERSDHP